MRSHVRGALQHNIFHFSSQAAYNHRQKQRHREWLENLSSSAAATVTASSLIIANDQLVADYVDEIDNELSIAAVVAPQSIVEEPCTNRVAVSSTELGCEMLHLSKRSCVSAIACTEDSSIKNFVKLSDEYYRQFTNSIPATHHDAVELFGRCRVLINNQLVDATVGGIFFDGHEDLEDHRVILSYQLYDVQGVFMGFFSSGRVTARHEGWEESDKPINALLDQQKNHFDAQWCIVLTGTFPELGGGSGLELGKAALRKLVEDVPRCRVVNALSGKTTHLVIGEGPGQQKIHDARLLSHVSTIRYKDFLDILEAKKKNSIAEAAAIAASKQAREANFVARNQSKHFAYFCKRSWRVLECGGAGDCFFYTVLHLKKVHNIIADMFKTHAALRKQVVNHLKTHQDAIRVNAQPARSLLDPRGPAWFTKMLKPHTYVEYEIICGFAHMIDQIVVVYTVHCTTPLVGYCNYPFTCTDNLHR
jgi:hypothetical protein